MDIKTSALTESILAHLEIMERAGAFHFRTLDAQECEAQGLLPVAAIKDSVKNSVESYVVLIGGKVAAVWGFGVSSVLGECCYPWILTTELIESHKIRYARGSKRVVEYLLSRFPRLQIAVDCRYMQAIGWLEWLGFDAHPTAIRIGPKNLPFLVMTIQNETYKDLSAWDH